MPRLPLVQVAVPTHIDLFTDQFGLHTHQRRDKSLWVDKEECKHAGMHRHKCKHVGKHSRKDQDEDKIRLIPLFSLDRQEFYFPIKINK